MTWTVETLGSIVDEELADLPAGLRTRMLRLFEMVETYGLDEVGAPHTRHLNDKLWEFRAKASEGIARGIYVAVVGRRVVVLHVFEKKSQKTPMRALAIARERMKGMIP